MTTKLFVQTNENKKPTSALSSASGLFWTGQRIAGVSSNSSSTNLLIEIIIFLIALGQMAEIQIVGRLYVSELTLAILLPYLLVYRSQRLLPLLGLPLLLAWFGWLGAQVASDVLNDSAVPDRLRGVAKIAFVAVDIVGPLLLVDSNPRRIVAFGLGLAVGTAITVALDPEFGSNFENYWKFALGRSVVWTIALIVPLLIPWARPSLRLAALLTAVGLLSVVLGSRSLGLFALATAACLVLQRFHNQGGIGAVRGLSLRATFAAPITIMFVVVLSWQTYEVAASRGWLSDRQQIKREVQGSGQFGTLVGSRPELLVSWKAIAEAPLLGHGSWAHDQAYADEEALLLYRLGYRETFVAPTDDLIPTHSLILGSWVEAGIAGAIFWVIVFVIGLRAAWHLYRFPSRLGAYGFFVTIWLLWDCLFSPIGASSRLPTSWSVALALMIVAAARRPNAARPAHASPMF